MHDTERLLALTLRMRSLARATLGRGAAEDDVAQDAWLRALSNSSTPEDVDAAWLAGVARNVAREHGRAARRRRAHEAAAGQRDAHPAGDDRAVEALDTLEHLTRAIRALPQPYQAAVVLQYLNGLPPKEAAQALGVARATYRSHVRRGLAQLRETLGGRRRLAPFPLVAQATSLLRALTSGGSLMAHAALTRSTAALALLLAALVGGALFTVAITRSEEPPPPELVPAPLEVATGTPRLEGHAAPAEPPSDAERASHDPGLGRTARGEARLRVRIVPPTPRPAYDHGASWVYALPAQTDVPAGAGAGPRGVRVAWTAGGDEVELDLPRPGRWHVGVNTDLGHALVESVEVVAGGTTPVALRLAPPAPETERVVARLEVPAGAVLPDALRARLHVEPAREEGTSYTTMPGPGERPLPRPRTLGLDWYRPLEVPVPAAPGLVSLTVTLQGEDAHLWTVSPLRHLVWAGETAIFEVEPAGTEHPERSGTPRGFMASGNDPEMEAAARRRRYPIRLHGVERLADETVEVHAVGTRDGSAFPVHAPAVPVEPDALLAVEELLSDTYEDWEDLTHLTVVRLPFLVARTTTPLVRDRERALTWVRGGYLVCVPSHRREDTNLELVHEDGGILTTLEPGYWRETYASGIEQAGAAVDIEPGTVLGPLPPGTHRFRVLVAGVVVARASAEVVAGRLVPLVLELE